jgi:hypothetical protein
MYLRLVFKTWPVSRSYVQASVATVADSFKEFSYPIQEKNLYEVSISDFHKYCIEDSFLSYCDI